MASSVDPNQDQRAMPGTLSPSGGTVASYELHQRRTSLKRPVLYHRVQVSVRDVPSPGLRRTIAAWAAMSSTYAHVEINVQCSAAGARWERIVEKGPRLSSVHATADHHPDGLSAMAELI
jgi:hypothetical protein